MEDYLIMKYISLLYKNIETSVIFPYLHVLLVVEQIIENS